MKKFVAPDVMFVYFKRNDVIAASTLCECVDCQTCYEGSNDCRCVDSWSSDYRPGNT